MVPSDGKLAAAALKIGTETTEELRPQRAQKITKKRKIRIKQ